MFQLRRREIWRVPGALIPALALGGVFGCLWLSVRAGSLPPVFPPLDGSVSVSRACREPPAIYLFRATVIPAAIFGALWWRAASPFAGSAKRAVLILGIAGVAGFFMYALALGVPGMRPVRRVAIYVFLFLTIAAQIVFARAPAKQNFAARRFFFATCALPLICLSLLPLGAAILGDWDRAENFAEWHTLWLMLLWFPAADRFLRAAARR
ncbi:MAG: hypothetical protein ACR2QC_10495 [Gammaproteobacteria bacterium]